MKRLLKYIWAWLWFHSRLLHAYTRLRDGGPGGRAVILMYHRVVPEARMDKICSLPEIVVTERSFESQLEFLAGRHKVISPADLSPTLRERKAFPPGAAVITFDDGWEDNYQYAWPLLKKYNLPATIFLTAGFIGTRELFWQEKALFLVRSLLSEPDMLKECFTGDGLEALHPALDNLITGKSPGTARLSLLHGLMEKSESVIEGVIGRMLGLLNNPALPVEDNALLNWEQVSEMNGPLVSFGSHGLSHKLLDRQSDEGLAAELKGAGELLADKVKGPVRHFAYPNGNYDDRVIRRLRESGYEAAVTTEEGSNTASSDPFRLKRINICENRFRDPGGRFSKELFAAYLAGLL